jgi:hypothetical protein
MAEVLEKAKSLAGKYGGKFMRWATPYELRPHEHVRVTPDSMTTEFHQIKKGPPPKERGKYAKFTYGRK